MENIFLKPLAEKMNKHPLISSKNLEYTDIFNIEYDSEIAKLWDTIENEFCVVGECIKRENGTVDMLELDNEKLMKYDSGNGTFLPCDLELLKEKAVASAFGRGNETVVDETVRKSLEIDADCLVPGGILDNQDNSINDYLELNKLRDFLGIPKYILVPHKFLIYEKGGHFEEHVDSKHSEDQVASLLVHLPVSDYKGGELVVKHNGREKVVDFSGKKELAYVAFFTDCPHKVMPITEGVRVMMQYDVCMEEPYDGDTLNLYSEASMEFGTELGKSFNDDSYYEERKLDELVDAIEKELLNSVEEIAKIALMLKHRYSASDCHIPKLLKGADAALYNRLMEKFSVKTLNIVVKNEMYHGDENEMSTDFQLVTSCGQLAEGDADDMKLFVSSNPGLEFYHHTEGSEYTGNSAAPEENRYLGAAFIIERKKKEN